MIDLRGYTHIIWDWNGTLLNDAWLCVDVMNGMLAERGLPLKTLDEYRELFDFPVRDYYQKLGYDFDKESFDYVGMEFIIRYNKRQKETKLQHDAHEVLERFTTLGLSQNILSAREHNELLTETKFFGVNKFFDLIFGLDDHYAHGKTQIGIQLLREIGANHEKILFIGDTLHDAEVAREIGVDCVLIANGHHSEERLKVTGLPIFHTLFDLIR